jgi:hypothetical protein
MNQVPERLARGAAISGDDGPPKHIAWNSHDRIFFVGNKERNRAQLARVRELLSGKWAQTATNYRSYRAISNSV